MILKLKAKILGYWPFYSIQYLNKKYHKIAIAVVTLFIEYTS